MYNYMYKYTWMWQRYLMTVYVPNLVFLVHVVAEKLALILESLAGVCYLTLTFDLRYITTL